jgi:hypothetical protein
MAGLWEKANEVSEISYKIHSAAMIVELVAERISDNAESGALWAASELLQELSERLEGKANDIMLIEKALAAQQIKPKGKKK